VEEFIWAAPITAMLGLVGFVIHNNIKNDNKVNRVYERLDEVKKDSDCIFVRKDLCQVLNEQMRQDIQEIKQDVKMILRQTNGKKND